MKRLAVDDQRGGRRGDGTAAAVAAGQGQKRLEAAMDESFLKRTLGVFRIWSHPNLQRCNALALALLEKIEINNK